MADLIENPLWTPGIYQLEEEDLVLGGAEGTDNVQAKQLANRTQFLKALCETLGEGKQPLDATLTALAALATVADKLIYATGVDTFDTTTLSAFSRTLLDDADAAAARATLGAAPLADPALTGSPTAPTAAPGTNTTQLANTEFVHAAVAALVASSPAMLDTLNELATALGNDPNFATTITTALGNKQPLDATLTSLAALAMVADKIIYATGEDTFATATLTAFARSLLDDADAAAARATLGAAALAAVNVFTSGNTCEEKPLPATTGTVTLDLAAGVNFGGQLTGNITLANPTGLQAGKGGVIRIVNDAATPRTIAYGSLWKTPGGAMPALTAVAGAVDVFGYYVESASRITLVQQQDSK